MNLVKKAMLFYKQEGLINTVKRTFNKCVEIMKRVPNIIKERILWKKYIKELSEQIAGKQVFVIIPCIDWNIPLFQRPHQIAKELSKTDNSIVLFISDQYRYDNFAGYYSIDKNLFLYSPRMMDKLNNLTQNAQEVTVFMSWMRHSKWLDQFSYNKLVYEYIDDLSLFYYHTQNMIDEHYRLMKCADITVCTARELYEKALPYAKKAILSPNAGDYVFFKNNSNVSVNKLLEGKLCSAQCVIGYYGCLAKWFDYDLVLQVARTKPQWYFVLVGYCFDGTAEILKNYKLENIICIPAQPYQQLPSFISAFDIQCIPFVINDITKSTSPVKLFEYMASGKPILTSRLPECLQYKSVETYVGIEDFIVKVDKLIQLKNNSTYLQLLDEEARENTWAARVKTILSCIE
ncbi:MAG: glycosyltransferase [Angelakisella sp.]|nr:glycosyltransferase [Angelakisella sp.]